VGEVRRIDSDEAGRLVLDGGYIYLDVRSVPEWSAGHPAGSLNVPLMHAAAGGMRQNPAFLDVVKAILSQDAKVIVGCATGKRSAMAASMLADAGYADVLDYGPSFSGVKNAFGKVLEPGWVAKGLPCETETAGASWPELAARAGIEAGPKP
jgi:rhodanese-related sulfurtransferase